MKQQHLRLILSTVMVLATLAVLFGLSQPQRATGSFTTIYPLVAVRDNTIRTVQYFFNPGDTTATLTLVFGSASADFTIPPKSTLALDDTNFPQIDAGQYAVFATSDQAIEGNVMVYTYPESLVGIYRGMAPGLSQVETPYLLHFGPLSPDSVLRLVNGGGVEAYIQLSIYDQDGQAYCTITQVIGTRQLLKIPAKDCAAEITPGSRFTVTSSQPLAGLLNNPSLFFAGYDTQRPGVYEPLQLAESSNAVYRFFMANIHGTRSLEYSSYSEYYMASNTGSGMAYVTSSLYRENGSILDTNTIALTPNASRVILPAGTPAPGQTIPRQAGMAVSANQPLVYGSKVIANPTRVPNYSFASYAADSFAPSGEQGTILLPGLANDDHTRSTVTLINRSEGSAATVLLKLYNADGSLAGQDALDLGPLHWKQYDLAAFPNLGYPFHGSAVITGTQPVNAVVDAVNKANIASCAPTLTLSNDATGPLTPFVPITFTAALSGPEPATFWWKLNGMPLPGIFPPAYQAQYLKNLDEGMHIVSVTAYTSCGQVTASNSVTVGCVAPRVILIQDPAGVIYAGDTLQFTAQIEGSQPLDTYWIVDGQTVSQTGPAFSQAFAVGNHTVTVWAHNLCGPEGSSDTSDTRSFTVLEPPPPDVDLSLSTLEASMPGVQSEDEIQYTAILRNSGQAVSPNSSFANHLPDGLEYLPESAQASDGTPVSFDVGLRTLTWFGAVDPGSPVIITYKARVSGEPPADGKIVNTAQVIDNSSKVTPLSSTIPFRKGYRLVINDGALATGSLQVDLTFTYDVTTDGVLAYRLSNNEAFDAPGTTDWLTLTASPQTHTGWQLDPYGDPRLPRTVYIMFRTGGLTEIGPFSATILYDVQPPAAPVINTAGAAPARSGFGSSAPARLIVTTTDDNSGVAAILVSSGSEPDLAFPTTGRVTSVAFTPTGSGAVMVRARDRSGNVGPAVKFGVYKALYLPMTQK